MDNGAQKDLRGSLLGFLVQQDASYRDATLLSAPEAQNKVADVGTGWYDTQAAWLDHHIVDTTWFEVIMGFVIITGAATTAMQVEYPSYYEKHPNAAANVIDMAVIYIFCIETLVRIVAKGTRPWCYFIGHSLFTKDGKLGTWESQAKWQCFDFAISWVSFAFLFLELGTATGALNTLRLLRVLRLLTLMTRSEELVVILRGFEEGMKSFVYVVALLALVVYGYAIVGITLFQQNDPAHFGNLSVAVLSLLRCATLSQWFVMLYINWYGCDVYPGGHYRVPDSFYPRDEDPDTGDPLPFDDDGKASVTYQKTVLGNFPEYICREPEGKPIESLLFFFSFTLLSAFVILSLIVGVVTISMEETMTDLHMQKTRQRRDTALRKRWKASPILYARYVFGGISGKTQMMDVDGLPRVQVLQPAFSKRAGSLREQRRRHHDKRQMALKNRSTGSEQQQQQRAGSEADSPEDGDDDDNEEFVFGVETPRRATLAHLCRMGIRGRVQVKAAHMPAERKASARTKNWLSLKRMAAAKRRERERESEEGGGSAEPPPTAKLGRSERSDSLKKAERKERAYEEEQQLQGGASFLGSIGGLVERWYLEVVSVRARRFVQGSVFGGLLILFILLYGALVGVQTVRALRTHPVVVWLGVACVAFFALEVVLKLIAEGDRPLAYFNDGYNVFDFVLAVAGVATLCVGGSQNLVVSLLRMLRLVQLFKLAHKLPRLQLVTEALLYGMISMLWVVLLFALFNFLCALLGTILFRANDPFHFGKFGRSLATLWRIETLNDWETPMYVNMYGCEHYGYYGTAAYNYNNLTLPAAAAATCPGSSCEAVDGESFCGFDYEDENGESSDNGNNNANAAAAANACRSCGSYEAPGDCFRDRRLAGPRAQRECALRCFYYPGNGNGGQRPRVDPATQATDQAEGIRYALSGGGRSSQQQHQQNAAVAQRGRHRFYEVPYSCEVGGRNAAGYRPLGWAAALYFLVVATVGGLILPTLLTAVVTASTVHMSALFQERRENDGKLRGVVRVVAAYLHPTRVVIFRELFDNLDINGNGTLDMAELRPAFTALSDEMLKHMSPEFLQKLFDLVDTDRSGSVDFSEFLLFFSRLTSAMALRLGRPSHEFVTNPRTFEREFVRLCLEMVYGVVPVDMAMDYDENDEGNSENENENENENDDGGGDGFGAADDATPSAAARSSKKAATRGVGIGQQLIDDFAALTGRAPAPGVSISPSTIFDVFDTKQLHRHIRWLASRLEATTTEAEAARRELRMLKETLGAFDAPPPRDAARVPVWGLADKNSGSGSSSSLLQGPSSSTSSSAAGAEAAARRYRGGSRGSGRAEEATRSQRVRSLEHELWSSLDPDPAAAAGGGGGGNNNAAAAVALAHGDFREQWELKVTANQCLAANRAIAAASGRAIIAEAAAAAAEAERRAAEVRALARRRKERKSKARGRRNSSSGNGSSGSGGSKGTTMARDGDESERKPKEAVAMMTRHATSIASPRGHGKGRRQNDDSFDFEGENDDDDSARDDDETDPMETDLVLDDGFVAGEKIARSAAALVAQWRAAIDLASAAVGSAADRRRRFHAASKNPNLPVPAWSHQGGWAALASHSAAAPGGGGRSHASAGGAASSYMM